MIIAGVQLRNGLIALSGACLLQVRRACLLH